MARTLRLKALAEAIGVDNGQLSGESRRAGFPCDVIAGVKLFDAEEVRTWRAANIRSTGRRGPRSSVAAHPEAPQSVSAPAEPREMSDHERKLVDVLGSADSDPEAMVAKAKASYALSCIALARGYAKGSLGPRHFEDIKKQSEELRRVESDFIDLAERRGELIGRDVAKAVAGALALRVIGILNTVENSIANQFEIWLDDEKLRALPTEQRGRQVRQWFTDLSRSLRGEQAKMIEEMIQAEVAERA